MTALVTRGDAANLILPDASVDLIVTSPPYFGLRSYTDGGEHYTEQIGAEATPTEYLDALIACTAEWMRVLKPGGSIFVNLGDKYASYEGNRGRGGALSSKVDGARHEAPKGAGLTGGGFVRNKSLMLLPERYRIRAVDELGLIARAVIVWAKPNGLPESVTDRVRRAHEDWVHLTKGPRYFSAVDEIREAHTMKPQRRPGGRRTDTTPRQGQPRQAWSTATRDEVGVDGHPLGKLPGSVWTIPTQPLKVPEQLGIDHFAAFPMEWPRRLILGWSPREVCTACGEGRRPVVSRSKTADRAGRVQGRDVDAMVGGHGADGRAGSRFTSLATIIGYACACADASAPATPGVVLDPFGGTGTTALVASVLDRVGISNDLSEDYCRLARWRTADEKERIRAGGRKTKAPRKPRAVPATPDNVLALFDAPAARRSSDEGVA